MFKKIAKQKGNGSEHRKESRKPELKKF